MMHIMATCFSDIMVQQQQIAQDIQNFAHIKKFPKYITAMKGYSVHHVRLQYFSR